LGLALSRGLGSFAFRDDGVMQFCAKGVREFVNLIFAIDLYRLFCGVADDVAVVAPSEMFRKLGFQFGIKRAVEKVIQLG
jgi:hypothetical protein